MADGEHQIKVNVKTFVEDFAAGCPDAELQQKYELISAEFTKVVELLKDKGRISRTEIANRTENLKVRFGSEQQPEVQSDSEKAQVDLDTGLVLHCPSCGAPVKRGSENCDYCQAFLDFSLKGKTINCPHCFARIASDSRFCMRCAQPVQKAAQEGRILNDRLCPKCGIPMTERQIGDFSVIRCRRCNGFFVPSATFDMMQENSRRVIFSPEGDRRGSSDPADREPQVRYVRCPVCRTLMNRSNFARISGVIIDSCRGHGIWFDADELEKIMDFIAHGGLQKAKSTELEKLKDEESVARIRAISSGSDASLAGPAWDGSEASPSGLHVADVLRWIFTPSGR